MERRGFIKALAAACCVPVVAAKAIARGGSIGIKCTRITFSQSEIDAVLGLDEHGNAYAPTMYDQSGNGNHLIKEKEVWFDSDWGQVKMNRLSEDLHNTIS